MTLVIESLADSYVFPSLLPFSPSLSSMHSQLS